MKVEVPMINKKAILNKIVNDTKKVVKKRKSLVDEFKADKFIQRRA